MEKQRERARSSHKFSGEFTVGLGVNPKLKTDFTGYDELTTRAHIIDIMNEKASASLNRADRGQKIILVIDRTPFYGEMGGQVGDTGIVKSSRGEMSVFNSIYLPSGALALIGQVDSGSMSLGDEVDAAVDEGRRKDIARNHTATHILQAVLRRVLGSHVAQRGSLVTPERLRFDFVQLSPISREQLKEIEAGVNEIIRSDHRVTTQVCSYDEAINDGATAIFEEKYGDTVRMVKIGDPRISAELCGGTHVRSTGEIGYFHIINEVSIGAGLRRIEAVTGRGAEVFINKRLGIIDQLTADLKVNPEELTAKVASLLSGLAEANRQINALQRELSKYEVDRLVKDNLMVIKNVKAVVSKVRPMPVSALMEMADLLKIRIGSGVIVLSAVYEDKPVFIASATPDIVQKGVHSGKLVKKVAEIAGGGGGGKPEMAQAGAKNIDKIDEALTAAPRFIGEMLG